MISMLDKLAIALLAAKVRPAEVDPEGLWEAATEMTRDEYRQMARAALEEVSTWVVGDAAVTLREALS